MASPAFETQYSPRSIEAVSAETEVMKTTLNPAGSAGSGLS